MPSRVVAASVLALALAGCGAEEPREPAVEGTAPSPTATVPQSTTADVDLYFLRDGKVAFARRRALVDEAGEAWTAIGALLEGPTPADRQAGLETAIPSGTRAKYIEIDAGTASVGLRDLTPKARAQIVYTLTQFPNVKRVSIHGAPPVTRADFEEQTPAILVESPAPWETVSSPLRIAGTANTFEATFQAEIVNGHDRVLGKRFVTATSGSGERGTFDASVPFVLDGAGPYKLVVYELSAEDGSRINQVEIPLDLLRE